MAGIVYRKPYLEVSGPGGENMLRTWGAKLIGVRIIMREDEEADEATFMFTRKPPYVPLPGDGTPYSVRYGWSKTNVAAGGVYTFQRAHLFGEPSKGQQQHLICRAGDLLDNLKQTDSEHFDKDNGHKTLGDVFKSLLGKGGASVTIHPDIAKIELPGGYALRWNQSAIDMATQLAADYGAIVKPSNGGISVLKSGSGQGASGQTLPTILIPFDGDYVYDVELEPRFAYSKVGANWLDIEKGTLEREDKSGGKGAGGAGQGSGMLPHPAPSQSAAADQAAAASAELARFTGQGLFSKIGDPAAVDGAPAKCSGFGSDIDAIPWIAKTVTQDIIPDGGWITTIETEFQA